MNRPKKSRVRFAVAAEVVEYAVQASEPEPEPESEPAPEPDPVPEPAPEPASARPAGGGKKRGRPADSPVVKAEKALEKAKEDWREAQVKCFKKTHEHEMIAWWEADSVVERSRHRAAAAVEKMCELERACWERSEAYTQARVDEAVECALVREHLARGTDVVCALASSSARRPASDVSVARYPWREEVCAMSATCPDPSTPCRVQSLHARGIL